MVRSGDVPIEPNRWRSTSTRRLAHGPCALSIDLFGLAMACKHSQNGEWSWIHGPVWSRPVWPSDRRVNPLLSGDRRAAWRGICGAIGPGDGSSID